MTDATTWIAAVGPIAGFVAGFGTEFVRGHLAARNAKAEREDARRVALLDRRYVFEQETLAALANAVTEYGRWLGATRHVNQVTYEQTGRWARDPLPDDLGGEPAMMRQRELSRLIERVLDDDLRGKLNMFTAEAIKATIALSDESEPEARARCEAGFSLAMDLYVEIQNKIGRQLRELYLRD